MIETHLAKIEGEIIPFDGCSEDDLQKAREYYPEEQWEYIGQGVIHSVNNHVYQFNHAIHHFFKRKS